MSQLQDLQRQLRETSEAVARMEAQIARDPESHGLSLGLDSLRKRHSTLQGSFLRLARTHGLEVCTYRLLAENDVPSVTGLSKALGGFQTLFSVVYDALRDGPKKRARLSAEVLNDTSFGFAYTFAGSLGIVMTLPQEQVLFPESRLDKAMLSIVDLSRAGTPEQVAEHAARLGPPVIRAAYNWARDHADALLSVDIAWIGPSEARPAVQLQLPEFAHLRDVIAHTSDEQVEEITVSCELIGADLKSKTFHLKTPTEDIRGTFTDAISSGQPVELPHHYRAILKKHTVIQYSIEEERITYLLLSLEPLA